MSKVVNIDGSDVEQKPKRVRRNTVKSKQKAELTKGMHSGTSEISIQSIEIALRTCNGLLEPTAKLLQRRLRQKITPQKLLTIIKKFPVLMEVRVQAMEELPHFAMDNLAEGIYEKDRTYTMFFIKQLREATRDRPEMASGMFFDEFGQQSHVLEDVDYSVYSDEDLAQLKVLAQKAEKLNEQ